MANDILSNKVVINWESHCIENCIQVGVVVENANKMASLFKLLLQWKLINLLTDYVIIQLGKGQKYEFHNVKNQKEHRKMWRGSVHRKDLLKWSERRKRKRSECRKANNHNVEKSWSLLQKSQRRKEWKEHRKSQFCLIFEFKLHMA